MGALRNCPCLRLDTIPYRGRYPERVSPTCLSPERSEVEFFNFSEMSLAIIKNRHTERGNDPKTTVAFLLVINPFYNRQHCINIQYTIENIQSLENAEYIPFVWIRHFTLNLRNSYHVRKSKRSP